MVSLLKHGVKLILYHFLGFLINIILSFLLTIVFYVLVLLTVVGTIGAVGGIELFTDFAFDEEQLRSIAGSITIVPILIIFFLYLLFTMVLQSMLMGGLYGSTIESVFENRSSIRTYFAYSFRNLWRLTGLQLAIFLLGFPIFVCIILGNVLLAEVFGEDFAGFSIMISLVIGLLLLTLFLHTPIFIIRLRAKIWRSIGLAFRLLLISPFRIIFSGVLFFGSSILMNGLYLLIVSLPALFGGYWLEGVLTADILNALLAIYIFIMTLVWVIIVIPFSGTIALLLLIRHYRQHFQAIVEPMGMGGSVYQDGPLFQIKRG